MSIIVSLWDFFENQFLKMLWLDNLVKKGLVNIGINADSKVGGAFNFLYMIQ
jgi:hypothetical protein